MVENNTPAPDTGSRSTDRRVRAGVGAGRLADRQLAKQLDESLAPYGQSIAILVGEALRRLHDEVAFNSFCRQVTYRYGPNILQVVMAYALKQVGREGYRRPG